jgi:GAF domain-containing protein
VRGRLESEIKSIGFRFPPGVWWILALWSGSELLGALTLDHGRAQRHLNAHERTLLNFFARQVAVTLERASLYGKEKRTSDENTTISQIGRQVSTRAATQNLSKLLEQVRAQISGQFDVSNFSIFLYDEPTNTLRGCLRTPRE